ncbi:MAG: glycosyltransferase family 9 protein [Parachlamydiales bacterium]|nr:glycosyltransferase family 9 protein [Parachlamydiales bacterium]
MERILILKTSSLGDIIQTLPVVHYLKKLYPDVIIDWVVKESLQSLLQRHPLVSRVISYPKNLFLRFGQWKLFLSSLREKRYDVVFDLQGNTKSMIFTLCSRARDKVGFGIKSVAEWPNVFATNKRFNPSITNNIRYQYLDIIRKYFKDLHPVSIPKETFDISQEEKNYIHSFLVLHPSKKNIVVAPCSRWENKKLGVAVWIDFLQYLEKEMDPNFYFIYGSDDEKKEVKEIASYVQKAHLISPLPEVALYYLFSQVDFFIGVDSFALHLCGTTTTPAFGIFGPSRDSVYMPVGQNYFSFQGLCPYGEHFSKRCAKLRRCVTGKCMKDIQSEELIDAWKMQSH